MLKKLNNSIIITIPSKFGMIRVVRNTIKEMFTKNNLSDDLSHNVQLVFNEICANIIEHAYFKKEDGRIDVEIAVHNNKIVMTVRDYGKQTPIEKFKSRDLDNIQSNGLGIYLIENLSDEVKYDNSFDVGTLTTVTFKIEK